MRAPRKRKLEKLEFAEKLLSKLKIGRKEGTITPEIPLKANQICADYAEKFSGDIEAKRKRWIIPVDVRIAVSYLCGTLGEPVASVSGKDPGYFYALTAAEFGKADAHLLKRIRKISAHYYAPLKRFEREATGELDFGKSGR